MKNMIGIMTVIGLLVFLQPFTARYIIAPQPHERYRALNHDCSTFVFTIASTTERSSLEAFARLHTKAMPIKFMMIIGSIPPTGFQRSRTPSTYPTRVERISLDENAEKTKREEE